MHNNLNTDLKTSSKGQSEVFGTVEQGVILCLQDADRHWGTVCGSGHLFSDSATDKLEGVERAAVGKVMELERPTLGKQESVS